MVTVVDPPRPTATTRCPSRSGSRSTSCSGSHAVPVTAVRFDGAEAAAPAPGVLDALADADDRRDRAVEPAGVDRPGAGRARRARRRWRPDATRWSRVSPIIAGAALKGPADRLLRRARPRGRRWSGVARLYAPLAVDAGDRRGRRRPGRRGGRGRACARWWRPRSCATTPRRPRWRRPCSTPQGERHEPPGGVRRRGHRRDPSGRRPGRDHRRGRRPPSTATSSS